MLQTIGLEKSYSGVSIFKNINLIAKEGEITVVAGPSGSGKTTLLRVIAGFEQADSGEILLDNRNITDKPPWERGILLMSQRPVLLPYLSVRENIKLAYNSRKSRNKGLKWIDIEDLIDVLEIRDVLDKIPGQLSGGQLQRASLAAILAAGPHALLLDEPFAHLDLPLREGLRPILRKIARKLGIPFLMVTHDQDEALEVSDKLYLLGRDGAQGGSSPVHVYLKPPSLWAARFFGHNVFRGPPFAPIDAWSSFPPEYVRFVEGSGWRIVSVRRRRGYIVVEACRRAQSKENCSYRIRGYLHPVHDWIPKIGSLVDVVVDEEGMIVWDTY